jgi:hypothetical protein
MDVATLTELLRDAEKRHGQYEPTAPKHHWSGWYAAFIVARENGRSPDEAAKDAARSTSKLSAGLKGVSARRHPIAKPGFLCDPA